MHFRLPTIAMLLSCCLLMLAGGLQPAVADETTELSAEARRLSLTRINISVNQRSFDDMLKRAQEEIEIPVDVTINDRSFHKGVQLEVHGGLSRSFPKKSLRLKFKKDSRPSFSLFGEAAPDKTRSYVLAASFQDGTYMRNKLSYDAARTVGMPAPRVNYVLLFVNSKFYGFYALIERIDEQFVERYGLDGNGLLLKAQGGLSAPWNRTRDPLAGFEVKSDEVLPSAEEMRNFWKALRETPATREDFQREIAPHLSFQDFFDWQMLNIYGNNLDGFLNNFYLYRPAAGGRFRVFPWDHDSTFGQKWDGGRIDPAKTGWHTFQGRVVGLAKPDGHGWYGWDGFSHRLFSVPEYCEAYTRQFSARLQREWSTSNLQAQADAIARRIAPAVALDIRRWNRNFTFDNQLAYLKSAIAVRNSAMQRELAEACERGTEPGFWGHEDAESLLRTLIDIFRE